MFVIDSHLRIRLVSQGVVCVHSGLVSVHLDSRLIFGVCFFTHPLTLNFHIICVYHLLSDKL
jgi:uncharacterized membrane protein